MNNTNSQSLELDKMIANLMVLISHHSFTQCNFCLEDIIVKLDKILQHNEIKRFPQQLFAFTRMNQLWRLKYDKAVGLTNTPIH